MQEKLNNLLKKSYSPYSNVKVASILITKDGKEYKGVNIENASYTPTVCAERTAIFNAVKDGYRKGDFKEIHLTASTKNALYPCGVCRQVMTEFFESNTEINIWHGNKVHKLSLNELMPHSVKEEDIK